MASNTRDRPWKLLIGRSRPSDLLLPDPTVSHAHAEVCREGGSWTITDLDSTNGVVVNGARVKKAVLKHGDVISLGRVRLLFGPMRPA